MRETPCPGREIIGRDSTRSWAPSVQWRRRQDQLLQQVRKHNQVRFPFHKSSATNWHPRALFTQASSWILPLGWTSPTSSSSSSTITASTTTATTMTSTSDRPMSCTMDISLANSNSRTCHTCSTCNSSNKLLMSSPPWGTEKPVTLRWSCQQANKNTPLYLQPPRELT